ncbi:MAG: hypothetical protein JOZ67_03190 [Gammaproteobacteria bacterium]|nr:hypothetical protein [Gammaproteobacteria bacterium]MBV9695448.1 hypothetical protein [Gammaproteobacteria bacterium]
METPFSSFGFRPEEAYMAASQRFFELLKNFTAAPAAAANWSQLAAPLAAQFEQWLRATQSAGPWFTSPQAGPFAAGAAPAFGPLPLGPGAVPAAEGQRTFELLGRLAQLQARLAAHWGEIARNAAQRFVAQAGTLAVAPTLDQSLKLYELWVKCAEEAYAATAHSEDFAQLQSELANVSAALLVEQRRHAEGLVKAFGLPTRGEVDTLHAQLKDLLRRLAALEQPAPPRAPRRPAGGRRSAGPGARKRRR